LEKLGVSDLIGTPLLKAYMHGFFMDNSLYNKVRAVANPFEYEEYRKKKIKERLEAKRASRIAPKASNKAKTSVNPDLADRLESKAQSNTKAGKAAKAILADSRFGSLFSSRDFEIDEEDENFKMRNPSGVAATAIKRKKNDDMDSDQDEDEDDNDIDELSVGENNSEEEHNDAEDIDDDSDSDDDGIRGGRVRGENYDQMKQVQHQKKLEKKTKKKSKKPVMYEANDLGDSGNAALHAGLAESSAQKKLKEKVRRMNIPLEKRFQIEEEEEPYVKVTNKGGSKEITYIPKDSRSKKRPKSSDDSEEQSRSSRNRRGVKELGFRRVN